MFLRRTQQKKTHILFFLLCAFILLTPSNTPQVFAAPNYEINYQGKLTNTANIAVADGTYNMRFWLLTSPSIATTSAVWTEELTGGDMVQVTSGLFSVMLGSTSPLTGVDFNQTLYLGVEIGGTGAPAWDGEMSPRKVLGAVPAAFEAENARTIDNLATTSLLRSDADDTASGLLTFTGGLISTASSTITNLTTLISTTTTFVINGEQFTDLTGSGLTLSSGALTCATATSAVFGCLATADWTSFNAKVSSTSIDTSSELSALLTDETGTGNAVFSASPTFTGTAQFSGITASGNLEVGGELINAGVTWTARTSNPESTGWTAVTYGNGKFVAVGGGSGNRVMTSPDGINWTGRTEAASIGWTGVTYGNGLFVAVASSGTGNRVMTSPDGITWTSRASAADSSWISVAYGNGKFVAVGQTGAVMTSSDGIVWTSRTPAEANDWWSVTYGDGLFVAVASSGTNRVMTSPDGITWTSRSITANTWVSVTYGNGKFVAVSQSGSGNLVGTSATGTTWSTAASFGNFFWTGVTYGNGLFVAVRIGGGVITSPDGITWTSRTAPSANDWSGVTYANGTFVAVSNSGTNRVMTSGKSGISALAHNNILQGNLSIFSSLNVGTSTVSSDLFRVASSTTGLSLFNITGNGLVGIGTTSPSRLLTVAGDAYFQNNITSASGTITYASTTALTVSGNVLVSGMSTLATTTVAYLGIGTTTPQDSLHIVNSSTANARIETLSAGASANFLFKKPSQSFYLGVGCSNASNDFNICNGNTLAIPFVVTASGDVGIGTTSPGAKLDVAGAIQSTGAVSATVRDSIQMSYEPSLTGGRIMAFGPNTTTSGTLHFYVGESDGGGQFGMTLNSAGNFGVGDTSPTNKLDVSGAIGISDTTVIDASRNLVNIGTIGSTGTITTTGAFNLNQVSDSDTNAGIGLTNTANDSTSRFFQGGDDNLYLANQNATGSIYFATGNSGSGNFGFKMAIDGSTGRVGIGTTSPSSLLSISNSVGTTANTPLFTVASTTGGTSTTTLFTILANGNVGIGRSNPGTNRLEIEGANNINALRISNSSSQSRIVLLFNGGGGGRIDLFGFDNTQRFVFNTDADSTVSNSGNFIFSNTGNVGIGSSTPSRLLTVAGDAYFENNITAASGTITYASTTGLTATNATFTTASTSALYGANLTDCDTGATSKLLWDVTTGTFSCGTDQTGGAGGSSNWLLTNGALTPSTTVGIRVNASSTIGDGTATGGLTILGNATTTGNASFGGNVVVGGYPDDYAVTARMTIVADSGADQGLFINGGANTNGATLVLASDESPSGIQLGTDFSGAWLSNGDSTDLTLSTGIGLLTITATGTVGIGTTTPQASLVVQGTGSTNPFTVASSTGTSLLTVLANGSVGIGTTTPSRLLTIAGETYLGATTTIAAHLIPLTDDTYDLGTSALRFRDLYLGPATLHVGTSLTDEATFSYDTSGNIFNIGTDSTSNGDIAFFTDDFYLDKSSGFVGIGSTTPTTALSVSGTTTLTNVRVAGTFSASTAISTSNLDASVILSTEIDTIGELETIMGGTNIVSSGENISLLTNNSGYLTSASIDTSAELATILGDETGSAGGFVRATGPTFNGDVFMTAIPIRTGDIRALCIDGADGKIYYSNIGVAANDCVDSGNGDLAENYGTDDLVERGDIVILSDTTTSRDYQVKNPRIGEATTTTYTITTANVRKATASARERIIGAVPTSPNMIGGDVIDPADNPEAVALVGHVPIHMTLDGGDVAIGDPITVSSSTPGAGMKALTSGRIIGYALEVFTATETSDDGMIEVYINPSDYITPTEQTMLAALTAVVQGTSSATFEENKTFWNRLFALVDGFVDGVLTLTGLRTDELCVGNVCVDEATFLRIVEQSGDAPTIPEEDSVPDEVISPPSESDDDVSDLSLPPEPVQDKIPPPTEPEVVPTPQEEIAPEAVGNETTNDESTPEPESNSILVTEPIE